MKLRFSLQLKAIMDRWFNEWKDWSTIEFSASKDGSYEDNTGRERLYTRYAKMVAKKYRAKVELKKKGGYTVYFIRKNISESTEVQLNEIGNNPYPWKWKVWGQQKVEINFKTAKVFAARAETTNIDDDDDDDSKIRITLAEFGEGEFIIGFSVLDKNGDFIDTITGEGDAFRIFATVQDVVESFIKKYGKDKIHKFKFKSVKEEGGGGKASDARSRIYAKWGQKFAGKHGGKLITTDLKQKNVVFAIEFPQKESFQLNEIGDRPMKVTDLNYDQTGRLSARAVDKKLGIELKLGAYRVDNGDDEVMFEIVFLVNDKMNKTGTGHEIKVFSTVKTIMETWLTDLDEDGIFWSSIEFAASKDGSTEASTSRERLYTRFAKMIAKKYRGKLDLKKKTNETVYVISRSLAESNEFNEIEDKRLKSFSEMVRTISFKEMVQLNEI